MQLRQRSNTSQWLIVVFHPSTYVTEVYLPLYLDKERGQLIVETWYSNSLTSIWLPSTMSSVMAALRHKSISCHFCHQIILREAGTIALRHGAHALQCLFTSEVDANDYFILSVIDAYVMTALHGFKNNRKKLSKLKRKIPEAKRQWKIKQHARRYREIYLGSQPFSYELRRSCEEFYSVLKKDWGITPERLFLMK